MIGQLEEVIPDRSAGVMKAILGLLIAVGITVRAVRASYEALPAAGAPEKLAWAAALNPVVLRSVGPIYFGHKAR
jgi:hypothetical protein